MKKKMTGLVLLLVILCFVNGCGMPTKITESMVEKLCKERNNYVDYDYSTAEYNENTLTCEGTIYYEFDEHMVIKGEGVTEWSFDRSKRDWICSNEVITMYASLNTNVEGLWEKDGWHDYIRIRNMTLTGFEVYVDGIGFDNWVFVTWNKYPDGFLDSADLIDRAYEDGACKVVYSGETAGGDKVEVRFTSKWNGEFGVTVSVDPPGSEWATAYTASHENYKPE